MYVFPSEMERPREQFNSFHLFFFVDKDCHSFSASHHHYTLYFKGWYQQNDVHKTKRPVRRRPADFVTKQNMKDIAQRYCTLKMKN